jgi:predicted NBD/HSP70 family sugar kinase
MYLCIDIGATKTLICLINNRRKILHSVRFDTPADQNIFLDTLTSAVRANFSTVNLEAVSIAAPGPVKNNQILWLDNLPWGKINLVGKLKNLFDAPIFLENDATLAALSEAEKLSGLSVYLTFSTGIGGGIARDGNMDPSSHDFEPGHNKYNFKDKQVSWEDFASAQAISKYYGRYTTHIKKRSEWEDIAYRISIGLQPIITTVRPNTIIFGGPVGLELKKYRHFLKKHLIATLPPNTPIPKFLTAKYKHESVIHGCYLYAKYQLANQ